MAGPFTAINLEQLPFPDVVETLDYEALLAEMKTDLLARMPELSSLLDLDSDPIVKLLQTVCLRELNIRQRINDAAKSVMLAYAEKNDLDNLGAFYGLGRQLITPADPDAYPPIEAVYESDNDYRRRIQLAPEGMTNAGTEGFYKFHTLSASPLVRDADIHKPQSGHIEITLLSHQGDGQPDQALLDTVESTLNDEFVRQLNDSLFISPATIVNYSITATLYYFNGPDPAVVRQAAENAINNYVAACHRMGQDITISGIHAALHQEGIQNVVLAAPLNDIPVDHNQAPYCTGITLIDGGVNE